ncbi:MAG TPA: hypothetical protein VD998_01175 [Verrucomicrobiae bacterium]|nr:hypothetical protein [Verrucomicrobiae bacterium]
MKRIVQWVEKHVNIKNDNEFIMFLLWAIFAATFFFSLLLV